MSSLPWSGPRTLRRGDEVYVAALPLRAMKGPVQMLMSTAYFLNLWDLQHYMVAIKTKTPESQIYVYDFQPEDPESIYVALAALSGRRIPGVVLVRKLTKLPKTRCWYVGASNAASINLATDFNKSWQTDLKIGEHDCRNYTTELVRHLTGEENILERLQSSNN